MNVMTSCYIFVFVFFLFSFYLFCSDRMWLFSFFNVLLPFVSFLLFLSHTKNLAV
ncbi:hypothetical protein F5X99DRAFT_382493 [Biscogniauxia marginata]|nr:hypothetical protein F5X99DRAFT_382493 [Biscogniauxia marginata]